jgi:ABC-type multidrug transport system ATPase subunit
MDALQALRAAGGSPPFDGPAIEVAGLTMRYGAQPVLRGLDLRVARGEALAVLGPNGAGKTTTMEILEGYRRRSSGSVSVLGCDPERAGRAWRERLGIVLQSADDHALWTVGALLAHVGAHFPRSWPCGELLARVRLADRAVRAWGACRAASAGGWISRSGSWAVRSCCSSTSRPRASTRGRAATSGS